jgi:hypothetical protein
LQAQTVLAAIATTSGTDHVAMKGHVLVPVTVDSDNAALACSTRLFYGSEMDTMLHRIAVRLCDLAPGLQLRPTKEEALKLLDNTVLPFMSHLLRNAIPKDGTPNIAQLRDIIDQLSAKDADWRIAAANLLDAYGAPWVLARLGVDYRNATDVVKSEVRSAVIVAADVRFEDALLAAIQKLGQDRPSAAQFIIIDMPFGYQMHKNAAPCSNAWDETHMTATEMIDAIKGSVKSSLALPNHVVIAFCAKEKYGEMRQTLLDNQYTVHSLVFGKVDSTRWGQPGLRGLQKPTRCAFHLVASFMKFRNIDCAARLCCAYQVQRPRRAVPRQDVRRHRGHQQGRRLQVHAPQERVVLRHGQPPPGLLQPRCDGAVRQARPLQAADRRKDRQPLPEARVAPQVGIRHLRTARRDSGYRAASAPCLTKAIFRPLGTMTILCEVPVAIVTIAPPLRIAVQKLNFRHALPLCQVAAAELQAGSGAKRPRCAVAVPRFWHRRHRCRPGGHGLPGH